MAAITMAGVWAKFLHMNCSRKVYGSYTTQSITAEWNAHVKNNTEFSVLK